VGTKMKILFFINLLKIGHCRGTVFEAEVKSEGFDHIQGILDQNQFQELSDLSENDRLHRLEGKILYWSK